MRARDYYQDIGARTAGWSQTKLPHSARPCHLVPFAERILRNGSGGNYLDIGCQAGDLIGMVSGAFDSCHGIDIGDYDTQWRALAGCKFHVVDVDVSPLPFPDGYFRVVSCIMVLEHVFDVFGLVREARRVLKPGGIFIVEVPNAGYIKHILSLLRGHVPRTGAQLYPFSEQEGWDGQHLHYFTVSELCWLLNNFGFEIRETFSRGRFPKLRKVYPSLLFSSIAVVAAAKD